MNERWRKLNANMRQYVPFRANMANIALCQLCRERQPFWNSHDGLNLTCLDQCHGVRWLTPKNCYTVYSLNLIDEFTSLFLPKVIVAGLPRESFPTEACLCGHECFLWLRTKILPRLAQGLFSNEKNLIEPLKLFSQWISWMKRRESWMPTCANVCHSVPTWPTLHFVSCAEKDSLSGTVMMFWIWHVWIKAMVFVGWRQRIVLQSTV